jgi:outer membrane murein-binding lipoprotein Lpp
MTLHLPTPMPLAAAGLALALLGGCANALHQRVAQAGPPAVQQLVAEDDQVRISELRVRGQTQRITVNPKDSRAPAYQITPAAGGSDPSQARDGAGQRVWQLLSF